MSEFQDTSDYVTQSIIDKQSPRIIDGPDGRSYMAVPNGNGSWAWNEITLPNKVELLPPKIITQSVKLQTVDALCRYMNRFKNHDSVLFADIATSSVFGVVDYHGQPPANMVDRPVEQGVSSDQSPKPAHTKHTASLMIPFSLEFRTWLDNDGRMMKHVEFSNFLEENALDIMPLGTLTNSAGEVVEDAPTTILELCRELQVRGTYGASSDIRNGDYASIEMQKGDDVTTKRNVQLPVSINLFIPIYFGEMPVILKAFIRRKVTDGVLTLGVKLQRPEAVRQEEFKRIVSEIENDVKLLTIYGKPA